MKPLPPTLRESHRYIAFEVIAEQEIKYNDLRRELVASVTSLFGDLSLSSMSFELINFVGMRGLLRSRQPSLPALRAALATLYRVKGVRVGVRVLGVSGTIAAATKKYLQFEGSLKYNISSYVSKPVSGWAIRKYDSEIDIIPDDNKVIDRSDVGLVGITIHDNKELI